MDAIAAAMPKPPPVALAPPPLFGSPTPTVPSTAASIPAAVPEPSQVVRAADFSPKTDLETEATGGAAARRPAGSDPVDMANVPCGAFLPDLVGVDENEPDREICRRIPAHITDNFPIRKVLP
ncbi:MAG: hypothetical protein QE285_17535 [Aquabacterium sp.]|nr:hypothetical protein [Aquabacterium sp.]